MTKINYTSKKVCVKKSDIRDYESGHGALEEKSDGINPISRYFGVCTYIIHDFCIHACTYVSLYIKSFLFQCINFLFPIKKHIFSSHFSFIFLV